MAILPISSSQKQRKAASAAAAGGVGRFLITVNVIGSAGPIRFMVNEGEAVTAVIDTALRSYAREGRRPVLGSDLNNFLLYCPNAGSDVLSPWETISASGGRNFVLCKKQNLTLQPAMMAPQAEKPHEAAALSRKGSGGIWKSWLHTLKISSH